MWQSMKCPNLRLSESEPRDVAHTSFIENLDGAHIRSGCAGTDPIARWKSNGYPGGCHLQYVTQRVGQHSTSNQVCTGLMTVARQPGQGKQWATMNHNTYS